MAWCSAAIRSSRSRATGTPAAPDGDGEDDDGEDGDGEDGDGKDDDVDTAPPSKSR
jgi:hypothetical protein